MPSFRGYNPPRYRDLLTLPEKFDINNPDGVYSGMTAGLAREDGTHVEVTDMPPDTRNINPLPAFDRDDLFLEDE
jgi:hypothetical protein